MAEVFLPPLGVSVILYFVAAGFHRLERKGSPPTRRSSVAIEGARGVAGRLDIRRHDQFAVARVCTAGMLAIQGTTVALIGLLVWPLWASLAVGSGFLVVAYVVKPPSNPPPRPVRCAVLSADSMQRSRTYVSASTGEGGAVGRSSPREGQKAWVRDVLFVGVFHAGLFANVGVVVALGGGPPWALAGGFVGPPLIVASIMIAGERVRSCQRK